MDRQSFVSNGAAKYNGAGGPNNAHAAPALAGLADWFSTPQGRHVLAWELEQFASATEDVFGFRARQAGLPGIDFLAGNRIPFHFTVAIESGAALAADPLQLPLAGQSVDLVVLPHALEFSIHPHQSLREAQRVLMPEGHAVITCFNPWSLWGLRRLFTRAHDSYPWSGDFITLPRLKDWLALLELEVDSGRMGCYLPPCAHEKWLQRFRFMEAAGDRWWPIAGGVYFLRVVKRLRGMRVILPRWREQLARRRKLAVVPEKVATGDDAWAARNITRRQ